MLRCPECEFEYSHHGDVQVFERQQEDGPTTLLTPGTEERQVIDWNPSARRDAVRIWFDGECGHRWYMDIIQHKGNTYIAVETMGPSVDALAEMPYADYLKTEHWQQVRQGALEAAGNRCQVCNSPSRLNVHHRTYERRGQEDPSDVIVLCKRCHETFHAPVNGRPTRTVE